MAPPNNPSPIPAVAMATRPSFVVLNHKVRTFRDDERAQEDATIGRASKKPIGRGGKGPIGPDGDCSWLLRAITLDAHLVEPPKVSSFSLRLNYNELERSIVCSVESAEKNIIVFSILTRGGQPVSYYLIYDVSKNSLSVLPHSAYRLAYYDRRFSCRRIAVPGGDGSYVLVGMRFPWNLTREESSPRTAAALLWSSSSRSEKWLAEAVHLPPEVPESHYRCMFGHTAFAFKGQAFWVDLLLGCLLFHPHSVSSGDDSDFTELRFVHLPPGYLMDTVERWPFPRVHLQPSEFRTMGRVGDSIRFVSIDRHDSTDPCDVVVTSWTLIPDLLKWERDDDMMLPLPCLWESDVFKKAGLPKIVPKNPVLSKHEDGILYLLLPDYYMGERHMLSRGEYELCVDMHSKTLLSWSPVEHDSDVTIAILPQHLGVELCA